MAYRGIRLGGSGDLLSDSQKAEEQALLENMSRREQIEAIFDEIISMYGPGGSFGAGYEAQLQSQKTRDVGAMSQSDISKGLYGIRPYGAEWEATTGASARLKLEDIRMQRLSQAQLGKAEFLERIESPYPDLGPLYESTARQTAASSGTRDTGGVMYSDVKTRRPTPTAPTSDTRLAPQEMLDYYKELQGLMGGGTQPTITEPAVPTEAAPQEPTPMGGTMPGYRDASGKFIPFTEEEYEQYLAHTGAKRSYTYK